MVHADAPDNGLPARWLPDDAVGAVLQLRIEQQVLSLRDQESRVRRDADTAIHQMRIAARRLRSALATYRPVLQPGRTDRLREELQWLGGELSPARDAQVMRKRLDDLVRAEPVELVMGPVSRRIHTELSTRYQEARRRGLESLDSTRHDRLLDALDAFVLAPPFNEAAGRPAREELPRLLEKDLARVRRRAEAVTSATDATQRELALHETRKAAKRLRYAAETGVPVFGRRAKRLTRRAKDIQDLLGEHQDTVVARRTLRELGAKAYLEHENGFTFGLLHAREEARAATLVARFPEALDRLPGRRLDRWLDR
jgi:CHAD domain-containing protein